MINDVSKQCMPVWAEESCPSSRPAAICRVLAESGRLLRHSSPAGSKTEQHCSASPWLPLTDLGTTDTIRESKHLCKSQLCIILVVPLRTWDLKLIIYVCECVYKVCTDQQLSECLLFREHTNVDDSSYQKGVHQSLGISPSPPIGYRQIQNEWRGPL